MNLVRKQLIDSRLPPDSKDIFNIHTVGSNQPCPRIVPTSEVILPLNGLRQPTAPQEHEVVGGVLGSSEVHKAGQPFFFPASILRSTLKLNYQT